MPEKKNIIIGDMEFRKRWIRFLHKTATGTK